MIVWFQLHVTELIRVCGAWDMVVGSIGKGKVAAHKEYLLVCRGKTSRYEVR